MIFFFLACRPSLDASTDRGITLASWRDSDWADLPAAEDVLDRVDALGANTVVLVPTWSLLDGVPQRTHITPADHDLRGVIRAAQARGLRVWLKPHVDPADGSWRGDFEAGPHFWPVYQDMLAQFAQIADETEVAGLVVGTELRSTIHEEQRWRALIHTARDLYDGPLSYAANWNTAHTIQWWDDLDRIGVDAYYPLASTSRSTPRELQHQAESQLHSLLEALPPEPPVWMTEFGFQSRDGAAITPWWTEGPENLPLQADCIDATLLAVAKKQLAGAVLWRQGLRITDDDDSFTVFRKPAEAVIQQRFQE